ncbi:hypothetical protein ACS0TY_034436 [Phlomoides rotata]
MSTGFFVSHFLPPQITVSIGSSPPSSPNHLNSVSPSIHDSQMQSTCAGLDGRSTILDRGDAFQGIWNHLIKFLGRRL